MPVTMSTADQALKILYLGVVQDQLNNDTDPLYNMIKGSTKDISGKEVRKMAPYGVNGGVGAGTETGALPASGGNNYIQFVSGTKNLYGTVNISDKSIQASQNSAGAFVQLLGAELEGLMKASKFNLSRQLWGDGGGIIATCGTTTAATIVNVDTARYVIEGLTVDIVDSSTGVPITNGKGRRITAIDRTPGAVKIYLDATGGNVTTTSSHAVTIQNSFNLEITGLKQIFKSTGSLYGVDRTANFWMVPYMQGSIGTIGDTKIQKGIDYLDEVAGSQVNYIACSSGVYRAYMDYMEATKRNVNTLKLSGGVTGLDYAGIPLTKNKFAPSGTMKLLNTNDFTFHHMGDWRWLEGVNQNILTQVAGYPTWTATLVRYAELICDHAGGQAELSGITES